MKGEFVAALLRGINVGGRHKLPMKDLVRLFEKAGGMDVASYIQSGNVIFRAKPGAHGKVCKDVCAAVKSAFDFEAPVVFRTQPELERIIEDNPFPKSDGAKPDVYVSFLEIAPRDADVAALNPPKQAPEAYAVKGREVYLFLPHGAGRSKLAAYDFGRKLNTFATTRNWNTVCTLHSMIMKAQ